MQLRLTEAVGIVFRQIKIMSPESVCTAVTLKQYGANFEISLLTKHVLRSSTTSINENCLTYQE